MNIRFQRPWFESCIQLRKTTCLLSIRKSLACARASKLTTTNMYTARGSGVEWAECPLIIGMVYSVQVLAWSLIAQSVCQRAFGLLEIRFQRPCVESCIQQEDYLSPFNSKIACLRPSIEMNNKKHNSGFNIQPKKNSRNYYHSCAFDASHLRLGKTVQGSKCQLQFRKYKRREILVEYETDVTVYSTLTISILLLWPATHRTKVLWFYNANIIK